MVPSDGDVIRNAHIKLEFRDGEWKGRRQARVHNSIWLLFIHNKWKLCITAFVDRRPVCFLCHLKVLLTVSFAFKCKQSRIVPLDAAFISNNTNNNIGRVHLAFPTSDWSIISSNATSFTAPDSDFLRLTQSTSFWIFLLHLIWTCFFFAHKVKKNVKSTNYK